MIAQAMVSICALVIATPFFKSVFGARQCVVGRSAAVVDRCHVRPIESEAGPGSIERPGSLWRAHGDALRRRCSARRFCSQGCAKCNTLPWRVDEICVSDAD